MADHLLSFEDVGAPPPVRPEPPQPVRTPCVGGPWNGATITHFPSDTKPRAVRGPITGNMHQVLYAGEYRYVGPSDEPGHSHGDGWVWHPYIHAD